MKKFRFIFYVLIGLLVALNIYIIYQYKQCLKQKNTQAVLSKQTESKTEHKNDLRLEIDNAVNRSNDLRINNIMCTSSDNNISEIKDLIAADSKLIFDFRNVNCNTCLEDEMIRLRIVGDKIGHNNIIYIAKFNNQRSQLVFEQKHLVEVYNIDDNVLGLPVENLHTPFVFVVDSSLIAKNIYVPIKEFFALGNIYYDLVYEKYFNHSNDQF